METGKDMVHLIGEVLNSRNPGVIEDGEHLYRHAGVLIPLFSMNGGCAVLFTKRTDTVEHHKGQISFPGGAVDDEDNSFIDTALRESHEEVGIRPEDVKILGPMDDTLTLASNFVIHPVVGLIPYPYDFVISEVEVERVIPVPLNLFHPENREARGDVFEYMGEPYTGPTFFYKGDVIWGATAKIMEKFMKIVADKLPLPLKKK